MILWGGSDVLSSYVKWQKQIRISAPNAQSMFLTEDFFKSIRDDLGLSNRGLKKGTFIYLMLRNTELFLELAKKNPDITLEEFAEIEKNMGLDSE